MEILNPEKSKEEERDLRLRKRIVVVESEGGKGKKLILMNEGMEGKLSSTSFAPEKLDKSNTANKHEITTPKSSPRISPGSEVEESSRDKETGVICSICKGDNADKSCQKCDKKFHKICSETSAAGICEECDPSLKKENILKTAEDNTIPLPRLAELLFFVLKRMKNVPNCEIFCKPVDPSDEPEYYKFIQNPMDIKTLEEKIEQLKYTCTSAFFADAQWILQNSIIYNSKNSPVTNVAKTMIKVCKQELEEIEKCPECYYNAHTKKDWFIQACDKPHILVWAKMKGYPYWPAKVLGMHPTSRQIDARFFGAHDKAWVQTRSCYLLSKKPPVTSGRKQGSLDAAIGELECHIANIIKKHGSFYYATDSARFIPEQSNEQLTTLIPGWKNLQRAVPKSKTSVENSDASNNLPGQNSASSREIEQITATSSPEENDRNEKIVEKAEGQKNKIEVPSLLKDWEPFETEISSMEVKKYSDKKKSKTINEWRIDALIKKKPKKPRDGNEPPVKRLRFSLPEPPSKMKIGQPSINLVDINRLTGSNSRSGSENPANDGVKLTDEVSLRPVSNQLVVQSKIIPRKPTNKARKSFPPILRYENLQSSAKSQVDPKPKATPVNVISVDTPNSIAQKQLLKSFSNPKIHTKQPLVRPVNDETLQRPIADSDANIPPVLVRHLGSTYVYLANDKNDLPPLAPLSTPKLTQATPVSSAITTASRVQSVPTAIAFSMPPAGGISQDLAVCTADTAVTPVSQTSTNSQLSPPAVVNSLNTIRDKLMNTMRQSISSLFNEIGSQFQETENHTSEIERLKKTIETLKMNHEIEMEVLKKNLETEKSLAMSQKKTFDKLIAETKRKQWCATCLKESILYCCWNTSYCSEACQKIDWEEHMTQCQRLNNNERMIVNTNTQRRRRTLGAISNGIEREILIAARNRNAGPQIGPRILGNVSEVRAKAWRWERLYSRTQPSFLRNDIQTPNQAERRANAQNPNLASERNEVKNPQTTARGVNDNERSKMQTLGPSVQVWPASKVDVADQKLHPTSKKITHAETPRPAAENAKVPTLTNVKTHTLVPVINKASSPTSATGNGINEIRMRNRMSTETAAMLNERRCALREEEKKRMISSMQAAADFNEKPCFSFLKNGTRTGPNEKRLPKIIRLGKGSISALKHSTTTVLAKGGDVILAETSKQNAANGEDVSSAEIHTQNPAKGGDVITVVTCKQNLAKGGDVSTAEIHTKSPAKLEDVNTAVTSKENPAKGGDLIAAETSKQNPSKGVDVSTAEIHTENPAKGGDVITAVTREQNPAAISEKKTFVLDEQVLSRLRAIIDYNQRPTIGVTKPNLAGVSNGTPIIGPAGAKNGRLSIAVANPVNNNKGRSTPPVKEKEGSDIDQITPHGNANVGPGTASSNPTEKVPDIVSSNPPQNGDLGSDIASSNPIENNAVPDIASSNPPENENAVPDIASANPIENNAAPDIASSNPIKNNATPDIASSNPPENNATPDIASSNTPENNAVPDIVSSNPPEKENAVPDIAPSNPPKNDNAGLAIAPTIPPLNNQESSSVCPSITPENDNAGSGNVPSNPPIKGVEDPAIASTKPPSKGNEDASIPQSISLKKDNEDHSDHPRATNKKQRKKDEAFKVVFKSKESISTRQSSSVTVEAAAKEYRVRCYKRKASAPLERDI